MLTVVDYQRFEARASGELLYFLAKLLKFVVWTFSFLDIFGYDQYILYFVRPIYIYDLYMDGGFLVNSTRNPFSSSPPAELPGMVLAVSGIDPSDPSSLELAKAVAESSETSLAGLYTHGGHSYDQVQSLPTEMGRLKVVFC